jgi:hypothetical protein
MTEGEFIAIFARCSTEVADALYPRRKQNRRRFAFMQAQGMLAAKLVDELQAAGILPITTDPIPVYINPHAPKRDND